MVKLHHTFLKALPFLLLFATMAEGQWLTLHTFAKKPYSIHFLDREKAPKVGFVGLDGEIWRSVDRGKTWIQATTPTSLIGPVLSFSFKDSLVGWCSADQQFTATNNGPGCYTTTDGGKTWAPLTAASTIGNRPCVFYNTTSHALILTAWDRKQASPPINSAVSNDDGITWVDIANAGWMNGISFVAPLVGIMTTYRLDDNNAGNYLLTTDGGFTWNPVNEQREAWQPVSIPTRNVYFASAEGLRQYLHSTNSGNTWDTVCIFDSIISKDSYMTGDTRGDWDALYVQTFTANIPNATTNILGSVTQGKSWINICGPGNSADTRMYWVSDTLWALDMNDYTLYYNPYGLKNTDKLLQFGASQIDLYSNGCLDADSLLRMLNFSTCPTFNVELKNINVSGNKSVFVVKYPILPKTVGATDSLKITFKPAKPTPDSAILVINYTIGGLAFEKRIKLRGLIIPGFQAFLQDLTAVLSTDCNAIDTFVTVTAGACSTVEIDSIALTNPNPFTLGSVTLPQTIQANGVFKIPIHIAVAPVGPYTTQVALKLKSGNVIKDTTITLTVNMVSNTQLVTNLTPATLPFDTTSTCSPKFDTVYVKNTLCKTLYVTASNILPASPDYSVVSPVLPDSIDANSTQKFVIRFAPKAIGPQNIQLQLTIGLDKVTTKDTFITITGTGYTPIDISAGTGNTIIFNPVQYCDTSAQTVALKNFGCDSLTIMQIIAPGGIFVTSGLNTAASIAPGDSLTFSVTEHPNGAGTTDDSVLVKVRTTSGAEQWLTVHLTGTVLPKNRLMSFNNLLRLDSLAPCTPFDTTLVIRNLGVCDTLILGTVSSSGFNLLTTSSTDIGKRIAPGDSLVVSLHFAPSTTMQGSATIRLQGNGFDTTISVTTTSRIGGKPFTLGIDDSLFTSTSCNPATRIFTFKNASCNPITIDASLLGSGQFTFVPKPTFPITIQPGDSIKLFVQFNPTISGDSLATFDYQSASFSGQITLRGTMAGSRQSAHLTLALDAASAAVQPVMKPLGIDLVWVDPLAAGIPLTSIEATVVYNDNVLTPRTGNITAAAGWSVSCANASTGKLDLCLTKINANAVTAGTAIANIPFMVSVGNTDRTTITLPSVTFNQGDSVFAVCVLSPLASAQIDFRIDSECAIPSLLHYISTGTVFDGIVIVPNPTSVHEKEVVIKLALHTASTIDLTLMDILGRTITSNAYQEQTAGHKEYHLPLGEASSGQYFVRVAASGQVATTTLIIKK